MVEPRLTARRRMEARFGVPGSGSRTLTVGTVSHTLADIMARLGIWFEGCRTIDGVRLGPTRYAVRYYDPEDQRIVAYEFDAEYRYVTEMRVDAVEWPEWVDRDARLDGVEDAGWIGPAGGAFETPPRDPLTEVTAPWT